MTQATFDIEEEARAGIAELDSIQKERQAVQQQIEVIEISQSQSWIDLVVLDFCLRGTTQSIALTELQYS